MSTPLRPRTTAAFFIQSVISFAVSLSVTVIGIGYLHDAPCPNVAVSAWGPGSPAVA